MDGRGGCCIARYAGSMHDSSTIDKIMLRFRPIAPKPATNSLDSGSSTPENSSTGLKTGRGKRRYVRNSGKGGGKCTRTAVKKCNSKNRVGRRKSSLSEEEESNSNGKSTASTGGSVSGGDNVVTLPLLPETPPERTTPPASQDESFSAGGVEKVPLCLNFGSNESQQEGGGLWVDGTAGMVVRPGRVVGTWVRVECITETWVDVYGNGLGGYNEEKLMNLEHDTCPGFISDGLDRVRWVNRAYREMVVGQDEAEEVVVLVWLVTKEGLQPPQKNWTAFTCGVRVVTCGKEKSSVILPCDVWRLEGGQGFAWRLDTKAALSLGR